MDEIRNEMTQTNDGEQDARRRKECALWLSEQEAGILLSMCSLSPVSAGDVEDTLFHKIGRLLNSFDAPHPKEV